MESYCTWCHQTDEPVMLPGKDIVSVSKKSFACPLCHREIDLISLRKASNIAGVSRKTIYQWIDN